MPVPNVHPKAIELAIPEGEAEPPLYRSRFGGLWTDRRDAHELLEARLARGEVTSADAEVLAHYIDHGYVVFPKATDEAVIDEYLDLFEATWDDPPERLMLQWKYEALPVERKYRDEVVKVGSLHLWFDRAGELIFPLPVLRFLTQIYERPPVAFQTLTLRKGSEERLHIDTGPLTLTEPMSLVGSWLALEDVQPHSGEFQFVPGTHQLPELLHYGTDKPHHEDFDEYGAILDTTLRMGKERGLETKNFLAEKGDVLIWHGDLMHGGAPIEDPTRTRLSMIAHLMPLGVMPTMFDASGFRPVPYPNGGYTMNAFWSDMVSKPPPWPKPPVVVDRKIRPIDLWRDWVPLEVRKRIPSSFGVWVRDHLHR
jgi:phytanoyl-CoA hydroxylase